MADWTVHAWRSADGGSAVYYVSRDGLTLGATVLRPHFRGADDMALGYHAALRCGYDGPAEALERADGTPAYGRRLRIPSVFTGAVDAGHLGHLLGFRVCLYSSRRAVPERHRSRAIKGVASLLTPAWLVGQSEPGTPDRPELFEALAVRDADGADVWVRLLYLPDAHRVLPAVWEWRPLDEEGWRHA